jgi:hypothetical protein
VAKIVEPSVVSSSSPERSCSIGIRLRLAKVIKVPLAKQPDDDDDAAAAAAPSAIF